MQQNGPFILYTEFNTFFVNMCERCKLIKQHITEYHQNYNEIPIMKTVLGQLLDVVEDEKPRVNLSLQTNDIVSTALFRILPYSLWPSNN